MLVPQVNALTVKWLTVEQLWRQQTHVPEQASERWPKVAQQGFILLTVELLLVRLCHVWDVTNGVSTAQGLGSTIT